MSQQQSISNVLDWKILYKKAKAARRGKWLNQIDWYILLYNCIHNFFLRYYYILKSLKLFVLGFEKIRDNIFVIFRLKVQKEIMKVTHTPHVLKWTKQSQPLQRTAVNSWTFPKSFQLISHREIAELQQIRVVWGFLILWNRFSHVGWISRPDYSPRYEINWHFNNTPNQNPCFCSERITFTYQLL